MFFTETYRCYSVAMCEKSNLETGDKIVLPPKTLEALTRFHVQFPMLFRLENPARGTVTHVGVSEFTAPEGRCYVPHWVRSLTWRPEVGAARGNRRSDTAVGPPLQGEPFMYRRCLPRAFA